MDYKRNAANMTANIKVKYPKLSAGGEVGKEGANGNGIWIRRSQDKKDYLCNQQVSTDRLRQFC